MFQQFKNIFPNAALNINSITNSISLPETSLNRLDAIKNEFSHLNSLLHTQPELDTSSRGINNVKIEPINKTSVRDLKATGKAIDKIQRGIEKIQETNEENYNKQKVADRLLGELENTGQLHYTACTQLKGSEKDMNDIRNNITQIQGSASQLLCTLKALEERIDTANSIREKRIFDAWKQKQEEELMNDMEEKRQVLKTKEEDLKKKYDEYETIQQKKRLELYEATFNAELEEYKRKRETETSSLYSGKPSIQPLQVSLDQLHLDNNKDELENFFGNDEKDNKAQNKKEDLFSEDEENEERMDILRDEDYDDF